MSSQTIWVRQFPFYSDKRAAELAKEAADPKK